MNTKRSTSAWIAMALAFCVSASSVKTLETGFSLACGWLPMAACLGTALVSVIALRNPKGGRWLGLFTVLTVAALCWQGQFPEQFFQLVYRISYIYNRAYHWGYFQLVEGPWNAGAAHLSLSVYGALVAMAVAYSVCRGRGLLLPGLLSLLGAGACFVVTDTLPQTIWFMGLLFGWCMLLLTSQVRRRRPDQADQLTALLILPLAAALGLLLLLNPRQGFADPGAGLRAGLIARLPEKWVFMLQSSGGIAAAQALPQTVLAGESLWQREVPNWLLIVLTVLALAAGLELQRQLRRMVRRHRQNFGLSNVQAVRRWQEVKRLAEALDEQPPRELEILTGKAKFSQSALAPGEVAQYDAYFRDARARLRGKDLLTRFYSRYILAVI